MNMTWSQRQAVAAVHLYQRVFDGRPSPCRFTPSCSSYALEAFEQHGSRRGLWLTIRRLARCRPLGPSGWDPVPACRDHAHAGGIHVGTAGSDETRFDMRGD